MSRLVNAVGFLVGALVSTVIYWTVVVYVFDEFNHGYGKDTWFQLQLYVSALGTLAGLAGYVIVGFFRSRPSGFAIAVVTGTVFTVCRLILALILRRALPDRDIAFQELVGSFIIGAAAMLVAASVSRQGL